MDEYLGATVELFIGRTKTDLVCVNSQCSVGEVVSSLGQNAEFCLTKLDTASGDCTMIQLSSSAVEKESPFDILTKGSREKLHLPGKWRAEAPVNKKLELKSVIIDWLKVTGQCSPTHWGVSYV